MDISKFSNRYSVKRINYIDIDTVLSLCEKNILFYRYHPPMPSKKSIMEDMEALPPGKNSTDKFYIGFWRHNFLTAVADIVLSYPDSDTAFIGFFMVDIKYQGRGVGSALISDIMSQLKEQGFSRVQLGIDKGNPQSESFWIRNGFFKTGKEFSDGTVFYQFMERRLI